MHEEDGEVEVTMNVDDGVELSGDTRAEIVVDIGDDDPGDEVLESDADPLTGGHD